MLVAAARAGRYARGRRHQDRQPHHACLLPSMTSAAKASPDKAPAERRLRLLSCNILAGASVQRYHEYVTRSINAVLPGRSKLDNLDRLAEVLPQFDVIGLQEADAGSLRSGFLNQTRYLAEASGLPFWSHQPNRPMARLAHSANGLISRMEDRKSTRLNSSHMSISYAVFC